MTCTVTLIDNKFADVTTSKIDLSSVVSGTITPFAAAIAIKDGGLQRRRWRDITAEPPLPSSLDSHRLTLSVTSQEQKIIDDAALALREARIDHAAGEICEHGDFCEFCYGHTPLSAHCCFLPYRLRAPHAAPQSGWLLLVSAMVSRALLGKGSALLRYIPRAAHIVACRYPSPRKCSAAHGCW
jgi:hypothetical protein